MDNKGANMFIAKKSATKIITNSVYIFLIWVTTSLYLQAESKEAQMSRFLDEAKSGKASKDRVAAINQIGNIGSLQATLAEPAIPVLMYLLNDKDDKVRAASAHNLAKVYPPNKQETIQKLVQLLKNDPAKNVKIASAGALAMFGTDAKEAIPVLKEIISKEDKKKAKPFKMAMQQISGKKKKK